MGIGLRGTTVALLVCGLGCSAESSNGDAPAADGTFSSGLLKVSTVYVAEPVTDERAAMYFTISNVGDRGDELVAVRTAAAGRVEIHQNVEEDGRMMMEAVSGVRVPSRWTIHFAPGSYHVMLLELQDSLRTGDSIYASLQFESGDMVSVVAEVRPYADLEELLASEDDEGDS
ncbi:MAG: copper chaperone PCu(A)C [Candidatus Palauibacterales bacterium]|nr:copper chaperone PCu(A)C [Candidatus Palauibacterales bacterium]